MRKNLKIAAAGALAAGLALVGIWNRAANNTPVAEPEPTPIADTRPAPEPSPVQEPQPSVQKTEPVDIEPDLGFLKDPAAQTLRDFYTGEAGAPDFPGYESMMQRGNDREQREGLKSAIVLADANPETKALVDRINRELEKFDLAIK